MVWVIHITFVPQNSPPNQGSEVPIDLADVDVYGFGVPNAQVSDTDNN